MDQREEGFRYGRIVQQLRDEGENIDIRFTIADQAKELSKTDFDEWMVGLKEGMANGR